MNRKSKISKIGVIATDQLPEVRPNNASIVKILQLLREVYQKTCIGYANCDDVFFTTIEKDGKSVKTQLSAKLVLDNGYHCASFVDFGVIERSGDLIKWIGEPSVPNEDLAHKFHAFVAGHKKLSVQKTNEERKKLESLNKETPKVEPITHLPEQETIDKLITNIVNPTLYIDEEIVTDDLTGLNGTEILKILVKEIRFLTREQKRTNQKLDLNNELMMEIIGKNEEVVSMTKSRINQ